jgi:uncharacterized membrane protein
MLLNGGFPLGFWFAQQGSIYVFVILIFVYVHLNKLDKKNTATTNNIKTIKNKISWIYKLGPI